MSNVDFYTLPINGDPKKITEKKCDRIRFLGKSNMQDRLVVSFDKKWLTIFNGDKTRLDDDFIMLDKKRAEKLFYLMKQIYEGELK